MTAYKTIISYNCPDMEGEFLRDTVNDRTT